MDLSIVIVTYNTRSWLAQCLETVFQGMGDLAAEVIVVDNHSSDDTVIYMQEHFPQVRLINNSGNVGFPAANNQGFEVSQGRYLLMLNPDTLVHGDALSAMVMAADQLPEGGVFGVHTVNGDGKFDLTCRPFPTLAGVLYGHFQLQRLFPNRLEYRYLQPCQEATAPIPVDWVQGSCLMFRRAVLEKIGGLDPQFFLFAEEVDFAYRARQAGFQAYYLPQATITHFGSKSTLQNIPFKIQSHHTSKLRFFRKHKHRRAVWLLKLGFFVELAIKSLARLGELVLRRRPETRAYLKAYWLTAWACLRF